MNEVPTNNPAFFPNGIDNAETRTTTNDSQGLDEAAEEYEANLDGSNYQDSGYTDNDMVMAFKAGAKWMAGQGYTKEETVYFERLCDENRVMVDLGWGEPERGGFNPGDKVIVQIRKANEKEK